ncbi:hypothetical protein CSUB01_11353 [Colletotrichum sublineola]|uniref:Uncharacterized protein n=1 Tax=Colletotrichum sublineola TaxID=1173701 RepID=A0A066XT31_COLSU|nr:hypothetical protein CSUB01_11353 [Colletotrichum sublineola]
MFAAAGAAFGVRLDELAGLPMVPDPSGYVMLPISTRPYVPAAQPDASPAKVVPQSYLHHLVSQSDDSQHSAIDRTNKYKSKGKEGDPLSNAVTT